MPWSGREYDIENYESGSEINKALSAANVCLYGVYHSVIAALGLSPGLGFVHTGHERSFVYDIADLYKSEITIPAAFEMASKPCKDIGADTRRKVRDIISDGRLLERCVKDIRRLLLSQEEAETDSFSVDILSLWDNKLGEVKSGVSYAAEDDDCYRNDSGDDMSLEIVVETEITENYQAIVRTNNMLSPQIEALTGITNEILSKEGRDLREIISEFREFSQQLPIVSHNVAFDLSFLRKLTEYADFLG